MNYIYTRLKSIGDWERARSGDPSIWFHDQALRLRVDPKQFGERAGPNIWTPSGDWDGEPKLFPCLAVREWADAPAPQSDRDEDPPNPRAGALRPRGRKRAFVTKQYRLPPEAPEKIALLCEVYRLAPGAVIDRLVDEAYRRDVVDAGMLAVLAGDDGILAPIP